MSLDLVIDLGLPGIVFVGLCVWLVRKVVRAARTERDLESDRFEGAFAEELKAARARADAAAHRPELVAVASTPDAVRTALDGADVRGARPEHVRLVEDLLRGASGAPPDVLWIRSNAAHLVWCERHIESANVREVIRVARIENGAIVERWSFG
jgi:hypothetical protein